MEDLQQNDLQTQKASGCIECGNPVVVPGYPNALCAECRENYTRFKVPKWIIVFAAVIGAIFLFSVYKIPKNLSIGIHIEKASTAIEQKNFLTAQKELSKVSDRLPEDLEIQTHLLMASFYNEDFVTFNKVAPVLVKKRFEDDDLFNKANNIFTQAALYYPTDSFTALSQRYKDNIDSISTDVLEQYLNGNKDDIYCRMLLANRFFDKEDYPKTDSFLFGVLQVAPNHLAALDMIAVSKRQEGKLDESLTYCDRILAINKESVFGMATKSRTFLKQKKDAEALALAIKSHEMDENNPYATCSLILAYHFTNKTTERDKMMNKMKQQKDSATTGMIQYVTDVISGKESFRN